jgi:23S rRNA (pseudouridine1915-N3)-methyltransferase
MKLILLFTGKTEESYMNEGIALYAKRLRRYIPHEIKILPDTKTGRGQPRGKSRVRAMDKPVVSSGNTAFTVLLDEKGEKLNSGEFAKFIEHTMTRGYKEMIFITGGAYGFADSQYNKADRLISLSDMTFTHQMVRLILIEQIYRAMTIIKGEPYHHQ